MEISINQRLKEFIKLKKIDPPSLYKNVGVTRGTWSGWINSNKAISVEKLVLIIKELDNINVRWLLTGEGEMLEDATPDNQVTEGSEKYKNDYCKLCEEKDKVIRALEGQLNDKEELLQMYRGKRGNDVADSV